MTTKAMSGLVNAAYWREPTKLWDWVGSERGEVAEMHKVEEEEMGDGARVWIRHVKFSQEFANVFPLMNNNQRDM